MLQFGSGECGRLEHHRLRTGSTRQASWRDPEGTTIRTRTREMAARTLNDILAQLQALEGRQRAARFAELAREVSDCGTAREGGDLGVLQAGEMMEEFEEAVKDVAVGNLSAVIQTESGALKPPGQARLSPVSM